MTGWQKTLAIAVVVVVLINVGAYLWTSRAMAADLSSARDGGPTR